MELVKFPSLCPITHQEIENGGNEFPKDKQNNYCNKVQETEDPASALEYEILQEHKIEEDRDHPIFHIYLTMDMLLKTLNRSDLLRSRGISLNFNFFATHVLLTSPSPVSLHFEYNWELKQYIRSTPPGSTLKNNLDIIDSLNYTLLNLSKLLETSTDFPCKKYFFRNGTLKSKDIRTFFQLHGWDIRALSLEIYCPQTLAPVDELDDDQHPGRPYIDLLRKLLLEQIPNVRSLKLNKFPKLWNILKEKMYSEKMEKEITSLKNSENYPYLTNLKNLIIGINLEKGGGNASSKLITEILETAINLENVYCPPSKAVRQSAKFHLLQGLHLYAACDLLEKHEQIATYPRSRLRSITIMLTELTTVDYINIQERFGKLLHKILEACSSTLEHIRFQSPCGYLCGPYFRFKIPLLPKVKCIEISNTCAYRLNESDCPKEIKTHLASRYFPPGFQFKTTFPHLVQITFFFKTRLNFNQFAAWEDHFDNYDPCLTVKSLIFFDCQILPVGCLFYCSKIFPNTEFLQIRALYFSFYDATLNGLCNFGRLKKLYWNLYLEVPLRAVRHPNEYPFLDAAFTGYSPEVVRSLYQEFLNDDSLGHLDVFQAFQGGSPPLPSILQNLKGKNGHGSFWFFTDDIMTICLCLVWDLVDLEILGITVFDRSQEIKSCPPMFTHVTNLFSLKNHSRLQLKMDFIVRREENLQKIMDRMEPVRKFVQFIKIRLRYMENVFTYFDEDKILQI